MRVRELFSVHCDGPAGILDLPPVLELNLDGVQVRIEWETDHKKALVSAEFAVAPEALSLRPNEYFDDGSLRRSGGILVAGRPPTSELVGAIVDALALTQGRALKWGSLRSTLLPDSASDESVLRGFGAAYEDRGLRLEMSMVHTVSVPSLVDFVAKLLPKRAGLALYHGSLEVRHPTAEFRELWRVLESAFGRDGEALSALIAGYQPAVELKFDLPELESLRAVRGRASHAASRAGLRELQAVNAEVRSRIGRLRSLAIHVILTKTDWGHPTTGYDRVARAGYVSRDDD